MNNKKGILKGRLLNFKEKKELTEKKEDFKKNSLKPLLLFALVALVSFSTGLLLSNKEKSNDNSQALNTFIKNYKSIKDNYYMELDEEELLKTALESIIESLDDPYSAVVDDSMSNSLNTKLQGSYSGFGIEIINEDNKIKIVGVISDSPAEKAKLAVGDFIISMDGKTLKDITTTDFIKLVKENTNKTVELGILRNNEAITFKLEREEVVLKSVSSNVYEEKNQKVGYLKIDLFAFNTDKQFEKELADLEKKGISSLIIDVRFNSGGHLSAVENILSQLLDNKKVIYQIEEKGKSTKYYSDGKITKEYPIIVLTNEYSASASEMLAAALKESYGAKTLGIKTFGKGTVQNVLKGQDVDLEYKLTTKKWLTPNGNWIHGKGIEPSIKVELNNSYYENPTFENDNQLQAAILEITK